jgi:hypothetical protein
MKQVLLIITILIIQFTGYSQEFSGNSAGWNNNFAVESEKNQPDLKIYPNPCKDKKVTLEFNADLLSEIRLINIIGKEILIKRLEIPINRIQLELTDVPNGIYMVQVKTSDDRIVVKKLLISGS